LHVVIIFTSIFTAFLIEFLIAYLPTYNFQATYDYIITIKGCENTKYYKSFQYRCFEDSSILMAAFGLLFGLIFIKNPSNLIKPLQYSRLSLKFAAKLGIMIFVAAVPAAAFLNPFWG
jgi:hypothetical protein